MDKLQPLLAHRFWGIFALALALPLGAWWLTTGRLQAEYAANTKKWEEKITDVEKTRGDAAAEGLPNEKWIEGIKQANQAKESQIVEQRRALYAKQQKLREWPPSMKQANRSLPQSQRVDFDDLPYEHRIHDTLHSIYKNDYLRQIGELRGIVQPYDRDAKSGLVDLPGNAIPLSQPVVHPTQLPTSEQIWHAQEDFWLMKAILTAVSQVNAGAVSIEDAAVRSLPELRLYAGYRPRAAAQPAEPGTAPATATGTIPRAAAPAGALAGLLGGRAGQPQPQTVAESAAFNPITEFGDPATAPADDAAPAGQPAPATATLPGKGPPKVNSTRRYVDIEPDFYRTRGFYLRAVVEQRRVPELVAALSNMEWRTQILRMNMVARNPEVAGTDLAAPSRPGALSGGAPGAPAAEGAPPEALLHPDLVEVAIAGLMTIYLPPPKETDQAEAQPAPGEPAGAVGEPAGDAAPLPAGGAGLPLVPAPAEPGATDPADPAAEAESAASDPRPPSDD